MAYASEGAVSYETALNLPLWELSALDSEIEQLQSEAKK